MVKLSSRRAQSSVEYMMYLSVIAIALGVAAYAFVGPFSAGFDDLKQDSTAVFENVTSAGSGERR